MAYIELTDTVRIDEGEWLSSKVHPLQNEDMQMLFEEFLIGSPAIGTSLLSQDFIDGQHVNTTAVAIALRDKLVGDIPYKSFVSSSGLCEHVATLVASDASIWKQGEFAYFCLSFSKKAEEKIKGLRDYSQADVAGVGDEAAEIVLQRFKEVDALYRHLRNSLAHGGFKVVETETGAGLFTHDFNTSGNLSAVMFLKIERLRKWVEKKYQMRNG